ncbi:tRNA1(Val) (adenine(37)-N6)-methyltransferase [Siphonobacter sp.]|uniref:tRNA1(Val) (adenine(37)-N6)-methyltransferase n=1 Tax=Siphonobacter sp. TaxID=1869184 RepID=UPI003B3AF6AD
MARHSYFRFKQFTIWQDQTAMKVCTDACVLGAWTPVQESHRILDIGTGTGLLPLMLAQRLTAPYHIHAVEIDPSSASQARTNVQESPFAETIHIYETAIQSFASEHPYDLIISNPPFFQNYLRSPNEGRNRAAHDERLSLAELAAAVDRHLAPEGRFAVLLPVFETDLLAKEIRPYGLHIRQQLALKNDPGKPTFRLLTLFTRQATPAEITPEVLCIRDETNEYTPDFVALLKDYYLIF